MNYIELIGPPGIGKKTLLNTLADTRKNKSWKTYEEVTYDITDSLTWNQLNSPKTKFLYLINKINIINYKRLGISNTIIKELAPQIAGVIQKKYDYLFDAQLQAVQTLPLELLPIKKYSFIRCHIQALQKLFVLESFGYTPAVVFDKGPCNTHHGLNKITPNNISPDTLPNAVIYCALSVSNNIERIQNQHTSAGKTSTMHHKLNHDPVETIVSSAHQIAASNLAFIKTMGIPVFEIDMTNSLTEPVLEKLHSFIDRHSTPRQHYLLKYA